MKFNIQKISQESGTNPLKIRIGLAKAFFEKGYALTNYVKWIIAFVGIGGIPLSNLLIMGFIYVPICFVIGWLWFRFDWIDAEIEVGNVVNPFVREMRENYGNEKKRKQELRL